VTEKRALTVYLAGPVSNCNEKQKTNWRKEARSALAKLRYRYIDPADHRTDWKPFTELVEIDRSDVVIANLWRESVGTVVGIVQARRKGKPVILVDPNYLDSNVLKTLVGADHVVHSLEAALNKLQHEVAPSLTQDVKVRKRSGAIENFSLAKLHRSLNAVCADARIDDLVLPDIVAREVSSLVRSVAKNGEVQSKEIKRLVFQQLDQLTRENDKLYSDDLKERAVKMKHEWEHQQRRKDETRALDQLAADERKRLAGLSENLEAAQAKNVALEADIAALRHTVRELEKTDGATPPAVVDLAASSETEDLEADYRNYFSNLQFGRDALVRLVAAERVDKRHYEAKFRLMNQGQLGGKHEVPNTVPLVWQQDAGRDLRVYF
jgi:nucleoside 2-deoxyribosyltransferase